MSPAEEQKTLKAIETDATHQIVCSDLPFDAREAFGRIAENAQRLRKANMSFEGLTDKQRLAAVLEAIGFGEELQFLFATLYQDLTAIAVAEPLPPGARELLEHHATWTRELVPSELRNQA